MYLTQGMHRAVQQHPDAIATVFDGRTRTHAESVDRISRLAGALQSLGVGDGVRAAILSFNSDRYHEFLGGTLWAGGVAVPVNLRWSAAEIADSLAEVDARILVVDDIFTAYADEIRALHPGLRHVIHAGDGPPPDGAVSFEQLIADHRPVPDARRSGDDLAFVCYTGGTTGRSKGVMLSHANLLTSTLGTMASGRLGHDEIRWLHCAPMFHAAVGAWSGLLVRGSRQVMIPIFEPVAVLRAIAEHGITDLMLVPTMIQLVVDHPTIAEFDLRSLRRVIYGASPMSDALLDRAMKALPTTSFVQAYGMAELASVTTILSAEDHGHPQRRRSAGLAAPHAEVRIVGPDDTELPRRQPGEILVRGGHVMLGYWERPVETAEALRGGWMHTGDVGFMDEDGYVYVTDRVKDMIISGGENVFSAEVENVLCQHPAVATAAVIAVPDDVWGERVHAVVVPVAGRTVTLEELSAFCRERIADFKAPRSLDLAESLPVSIAGKVLKRELRRPYWEDQERAIH